MISSECNGCEYQCNLSHIDICTLGSPCPHQRSTPMTNEEWFCGLDTEEKAKVFASVVLEAWGDGQNDKLPSDKSFTEYWRNWLMEIHE